MIWYAGLLHPRGIPASMPDAAAQDWNANGGNCGTVDRDLVWD